MKNTEGIILKKQEHREADLIYTVYSKEYGKIGLLAKGARKITAKLRPHMELFNRVDCWFVEGRSIRILTDVYVLQNVSRGLREDSFRISQVFQIATFLDDNIHEEEKDAALWALVVQSFRAFTKRDLSDSYGARLLLPYMFLRISRVLGFAPELYRCTLCVEEIGSGQQCFFRIQEGGVVCNTCGSAGDIEIDTHTIAVLRMLLEEKWEQVKRLELSRGERAVLDTVSRELTLYFS